MVWKNVLRQAIGRATGEFFVNEGTATGKKIVYLEEHVAADGSFDFVKKTVELMPVDFDASDRRLVTDWACERLGVTRDTLKGARDHVTVWRNGQYLAITVFRPEALR